MSVGNRIRARRKQLGLSVDQLAKLINKNRATIYRYESDEIENMPYDVVLPISKALNTTPSYLMGWEEYENDNMSSTQYNYIPVSVAAGNPFNIDPVESVNQIEIPDELLGKWAGCKDIFFMRVNGDSMDKIIPNGALIAVKKVELNDLKNNDIVVFSHNHEYSVKRFLNFNEQDKIVFRPDSHNPNFIDYVVENDDLKDLQIHGKVVTYVVTLD